jgi:hypothetical protein
MCIEDVLDYIKTFKWEDTKYPRNRSLLEITGMITEVLVVPLHPPQYRE